MFTTQLNHQSAVLERQPVFSKNILDTIGQTPLVRLNRIVFGTTACTVLAKVESFNPAGSIKDRIGLSII